VLLGLHAALLAWGATRHCASSDEVGHLVAGLSHLQLGRFDLYRVNPPLVRLVAAAPVVLARPHTDYHGFFDSRIARPEFGMGRNFALANRRRWLWYFVLGRWACVPFSVLGGWICYRWAGRLYGHAAGILALALWCFSPNVLAHGQMITPDAGATALGVTAAYTFWCWLQSVRWDEALSAGWTLGLAELAKSTWIVLFVLWPTLALVCGGVRRSDRARCSQGSQLALMLLIALVVINLGYAFEGSFKPLGEYEFVSQTLRGTTGPAEHLQETGNRFRNTRLAGIPVPLPGNYVAGIDRQKWDFERTQWSYLRGEWKRGGWWYYYLYALAVKVPLGTWGLVLLALVVGPFRRAYSASWRDELVLVAPLVVVLALASSQTGFNHHLRYVLPIFPFAFIGASKVARAVERKHRAIASISVAALAWSVASSLSIYPHSLSYFNELVGGPAGGHAHLLHSNIDWNQDLLYLKRWLHKHPEARPIGVAYSPRGLDPWILGVDCAPPPPGPQGNRGPRPNPGGLGPRPGWYAVSVNELRGKSKQYAYFLRFRPVAMAGYSIYVYHVAAEEANRTRRELGLPQVDGRG